MLSILALSQTDEDGCCNSFTGTTCQKTEDWKTETEDDWNLLGIQWQVSFILTFACLLALGLHLSSSTSCLIPFIVPSNGVCHILHYLNDFFTAGEPFTTDCSDKLQAMLSLCNKINAPVKTSNIEGPLTQLTFLGIVEPQ